MNANFLKNWELKTLMSFGKISPFTLFHLREIYLSMLHLMIFTAIGPYLHLLWNIGACVLLGAMGSVVSILCLALVIPPEEKWKTVPVLWAAGFFVGAFYCPLVDVTPDEDFIFFLVRAAAACGWFLVAAMFTQHSGYIYLCGSLFSCLSFLIWLHYVLTISDSYPSF